VGVPTGKVCALPIMESNYRRLVGIGSLEQGLEIGDTGFDSRSLEWGRAEVNRGVVGHMRYPAVMYFQGGFHPRDRAREKGRVSRPAPSKRADIRGGRNGR